ncbi:MAG: sugar phosphate isomerase/epimerase [Oscillospiraceae bacterium]|nr:sugar phosphate isomerase/epimerase [Oscillospiraceae bacterium]
MPVPFGMPTLIETKTPDDCAKLCRELGLSFVELNMNLPEYQADALDVKHLLDIAGEYGISYTLHLDENLNPCDFNDRVSKAYTDTAISAILKARQLSAPILNMHVNPGVYFTLPDKKVFLFEEYEPEYLRKLTVFRDACEQAAGSSGMVVCLENCGHYGSLPYMRKGLDLLLESPVFALTWDVGHNAAADYSDEPTLIERLHRLRHIHLHDADGRSNHLVLGEGSVDLMKYLDLAEKQDCRVVLEVKTADGLRRSVEWINRETPHYNLRHRERP